MTNKCICFFLIGMLISFPAYSFDINGDGDEGLAEAIHALQVVAGLIPDRTSEGDATTEDVLSGVVFSSDTGTGLTGTRPPAPTAKTGQTVFWYSGDDGALEYGVTIDGDRFTDNGDGTVTDRLTGLIWLKNGTCYSEIQWGTAMSYANDLANDHCGLTDGSEDGDWRLPNVRELFTLIDFSEFAPALPDNIPITGDLLSNFWSSTTRAGDSSYAWLVYLDSGETNLKEKTGTARFIAVKGGIR